MYTIVISKNELFRCGIRQMIKDTFKRAVVDEVQQAENLRAMLPERSPTILVLDDKSNLLDNVSLCDYARQGLPLVKIICFISTTDKTPIISLLEQNVDGYLSYDVGSDELKKCFSLVLSGNSYYNQHVSSIMHHKIAQSNKKEQTLKSIYFSRREEEILSLVCQQHTSREIGSLLNISQRTVDGYRHRLIRKCQVKNTAGLISFAIQHGIFASKPEFT